MLVQLVYRGSIAVDEIQLAWLVSWVVHTPGWYVHTPCWCTLLVGAHSWLVHTPGWYTLLVSTHSQ